MSAGWPRGPIIVGTAWLCFAAYVCLTAANLPERVATHFNANGLPDGWMTRATHVCATLIAGALVPAFVLGVFALIRRLGGRGLNVPHKDFWLAPERRGATERFIETQGIALAFLLVVFIGGAHASILSANQRDPVTLHGTPFAWISGGFSVALLAWAVMFVVRFIRKPA